MSKKEWCYSHNGENFDGSFKTKQEAIDEGMYFVNEDEEETLYVGQTKEIRLGVSVDNIIEQLGEDAYEQAGDVAEDYLCHVKREDLFILEDKLNKALHEWMEEYGYKPNFYTVDNIEKII